MTAAVSTRDRPNTMELAHSLRLRNILGCEKGISITIAVDNCHGHNYAHRIQQENASSIRSARSVGELRWHSTAPSTEDAKGYRMKPPERQVKPSHSHPPRAPSRRRNSPVPESNSLRVPTSLVDLAIPPSPSLLCPSATKQLLHQPLRIPVRRGSHENCDTTAELIARVLKDLDLKAVEDDDEWSDCSSIISSASVDSGNYMSMDSYYNDMMTSDEEASCISGNSVSLHRPIRSSSQHSVSSTDSDLSTVTR